MFLAEYIGPIIIWALVAQIKSVDQRATIMWMFHFSKRVFETLFVHRFSNETMPLRNLFKNCTYYWGFALANAMVCSPHIEFGSTTDYITRMPAIPLFFVSACLNGYCHIILRNLRPKGSKAYVNPTKFIFKYAACPNYGFEVLTWIFFSMYTRNVAAILFTICGFLQIRIWALQKKMRLEQ